LSENPNPLDTVTDATVTDPLSAVTRGERKALLAACAVGLAISVGGLVPQKIEALGIAVSASQKENLLQILAGVIAFSLLVLLFTLGPILDAEMQSLLRPAVVYGQSWTMR
jgi:hypothetical protein